MASDSWVVYSPNESAISGSTGFWSNKFGWVPLDQATCFTADKARDAVLPISVGHDARLVPRREAQQFYS
jgi:hypothetical protein